MAHILTDAALGAAPLAPHCAFDERARALLTAATSLLPLLEIGRVVESAHLRDAMTAAFGGTDAEGAWDWKSAYDACEVAQILFLRRFGPAIFVNRRAIGTPYRRAKGTPFALRGSVGSGRGFRAAGGVGRA